MKELKKQVRSKWLHMRLTDAEYTTIRHHWQQTTSRELSDYARRVLLKKPLILNHRNQSADEMLAEMIRLKNELNAIGKNFNQAVHHLKTLQMVPQVQLWIRIHENQMSTLLQKTEEIRLQMIQIYEQWSLK